MTTATTTIPTASVQQYAMKMLEMLSCTTSAQQYALVKRRVGTLSEAQRLEMLAEFLGSINKWHMGLNRDAERLESGLLPIGDPKDFDVLGGCRHEAAHEGALVVTRFENVKDFLRSEGLELEKLRWAIRLLAERNTCERSTADIAPEILCAQKYVRRVLKAFDEEPAPAAGQANSKENLTPAQGARVRKARRKLDLQALDRKARKVLRGFKTFPIVRLANILRCSTGTSKKLPAWKDHMAARNHRRVKVWEPLNDVLTDNTADPKAVDPKDEAIARLAREQEADHKDDNTPGYERA
ncbi:MAG: hypothetical protein ABSE73_23565 [Planctomycetota bacterium]